MITHPQEEEREDKEGHARLSIYHVDDDSMFQYLKQLNWLYTILVISGLLVCVYLTTLLFTPHTQVYAQTYRATTTVSLTVCGDGIVAPAELCDDGVNSGAYSSSTAARNCTPLCTAWGPYCGDGVIQTFWGEECDDSNNTDGDLCDYICQNESDPVTEGGGGSGSGGSGGGGGKGSGNNAIPGAETDGEIEFEGDTDLNVVGKACPGSTITVLRDGEAERVVEADNSSNFSFTLRNQTPGITTLGFWALDDADRRSITYSATFQIIQNAVTTLSGVLIPPTIAVVPEKVPYGGTVSFEGCALPSTQVRAYIDEDEENPEETLVAGNGDWAIAYNTSPLSNESFHTVKASYIDPDNTDLESGHSLITNFYVGERDVDTGLTADLNFDGFVNLIDFSILLFHWNTADSLADINQDGIVSLPDFSIMLFYWTG